MGPVDADDLVLQVSAASDSAEPPPAALERDRHSFAAWGKGLTEEQYLDRERALWRTEFAQRGLRVWILCDGRTGQALASCESYRCDLAIHPEPSGSPERGAGAGIASVYVEPALRGRGYASALLTRVHQRLRHEGALGAYLISEVGPGIYERLGYRGEPLRHRRFAAGPDAPPPRWVDLDEPLEPLLAARYRGYPGALTVRLSEAQLRWHLARGAFYAQVLQRRPPRHAGAQAGEAFALWAPSYGQDALQVLTLFPGAGLLAVAAQGPRAAAPAAADLRAVLHAAREEAHALGLRSVLLWENRWNQGWLRGGVSEPCADVPMIQLFAPPNRAAAADPGWDDRERGHWL